MLKLFRLAYAAWVFFVPPRRVLVARVVWFIARTYAWLVARPVWVIKGPDGSPYLTRVYLTPKGEWWRDKLGLPGMFLHYFHRSDHERELHNHPWSWALILSGGYLEERHDDWPRCYFEGDTNKITERTFHRVTLLNEKAGTWTLFVAGARHGRSWGFLQPDGAVVPFREYAKNYESHELEKLLALDLGVSPEDLANSKPVLSEKELYEKAAEIDRRLKGAK
jgi:hypothetical protein